LNIAGGALFAGVFGCPWNDDQGIFLADPSVRQREYTEKFILLKKIRNGIPVYFLTMMNA